MTFKIAIPALMLSVAAILILLGVTARNKKSQIHWDMPTAYVDGNYHTQTAKQFANEILECSGGEWKIVIHSGGSLFKGDQIKRAVQTGQVPIGERLLSTHTNENALYGVDSVPFIVSNFEESVRLWRIAKEILAEVMEEKNLILLYSVPWPPSGMYLRNPASSKDDLEHIKFRAYNASTARVAELAGMIPVQIEAAELNQALATGVVESLIASVSTGYDRKIWEQLTYFYNLRAWLPRNYIFANKDDYLMLSSRNRDCLHLAAQHAESAGTARAMELTAWYTDKLVENGILIQEPGAELRADLLKIGTTMTHEWKEAAGPKGTMILNTYNAN